MRRLICKLEFEVGLVETCLRVQAKFDVVAEEILLYDSLLLLVLADARHVGAVCLPRVFHGLARMRVCKSKQNSAVLCLRSMPASALSAVPT